MRPLTHVLLRWIPPVLVLGALGFLALHALRGSDAERTREETALASRVAATTDLPSLARDLEGYLTRYHGDARARWFAIETYARIHLPLDALTLYEGDPALLEAPGSGRRFASLLLRHLATFPGEPRRPTWLFVRSLLSRLDVEDPDAQPQLLEFVPRMDVADVAFFYLPAHRSQTRGALALARAWRARAAEPEFLTGACLLETGALPAAAPANGETLRKMFASEWRTQRPMMWVYIARALGTLGDEASVAALRRERDQSSGTTNEDQRRRHAVDVGLAIAGDPEAERRMFEALGDPYNPWIGVEAVVGLHARHAAGDARAGPRLVELVTRADSASVLIQAGLSALLSDAPPTGLPADAWAADLERGPTRIGRAVAHAWALRSGRPGAAAALRQDLRGALEAKDVLTAAQGVDDDDVAAASEALRALLRW